MCDGWELEVEKWKKFERASRGEGGNLCIAVSSLSRKAHILVT
jgi:hypothetical protein